MIARFAQTFAEGFAVVRRPERLVAAMAWSIVLWVAIAAGIWAVSVAFGIAMPFTGAWLMLAPLVVGVAVPTPGGVGGFHEAYRIGATAFFGADNDTAVGAAIVLHAISVGPVIIAGLLFIVQDGLKLAAWRWTTRRPRVKCPFCGDIGDKVVDSRESREGDVDSPPPPVPQRQVQEALHELRAHRRDPVHGGQEGRHARALRALEAGGRPAEGVREAADQAVATSTRSPIAPNRC